MKSFGLAFFALVTFNALAASDICKYEMTWEFDNAIEAGVGQKVATSDKHDAFTQVEKNMIHSTINTWNELFNEATVSQAQALRNFGDFYDNATGPGSLAGDIQYYNIKGQKVALVHYYPGDNEYGAFYEVRGTKFKLIATVGDSEISCK